MAGNVNTAPAAFWRVATKFSALFLGPRSNKETGATSRDIVRLKLKGAAAQTANLAEVLDGSDNVLASVAADGRFNSPNLQYASVAISAANVTDTAAGHLGHAAGVPLVADPAAGYLVELVSAVMEFTYSTAQYAAGGNITININGGAALTGLVSNANSLGAAADKLVLFVPLSTAGVAVTAAKGLNLVASAAFTQPGTAAGTVKVFVTYRVHKL